jgi:glycosyltransferase 2 family protein
MARSGKARRRFRSGSPPIQAMKRGFALTVKIGVSLALVAYLLFSTGPDKVLAKVRAGDPLLFAVAVLLYSGMIVLSTWRWRLLLQAQGFPATMRHLSASYLVATFFNNFLPSNIGGDVVRVRDGSRLTGSTTTSVAVIAIDRILGLGALWILAVLAFVLGGPSVRHLAGARVVLAGLGLVFAAIAYVFFRPGTAGSIFARSGLGRFPFIRESFEGVQQAVRVYREQMGAVWMALGASLGLQSLVVWYFYAVAHALRIPLGLSACFLMVPLCTLVQTVPVSFNGWGVRESLFVVYFGQVSLSKDSALAFSLVGAGLIVLLSLSGAFVWASRRSPAPHPAA